MIKYLIYCGILAFMAGCLIAPAFAGGYHHNIVNNYYVDQTFNETINEGDTIREGDYGRAASMSQAGCHFDMSTARNQGCVAAGYDMNTDNKALTLGYGKRVGENEGRMLLNGLVTLEDHYKPTVGLGMNFHF